ncbi:hypothetical protein F4X86_01130 [Candidatus Saccharibacteria bacterium]|nr:hypothetical protein [Candidatus Saccharibacteria bacterium]
MKIDFKGLLATKTFWWNSLLFVFFCWLVFFRLLVFGSQTGVHYHADFMIHIHGQPQTLDNFSFYEETSACGSQYRDDPVSRVHLHDNVNHVIHVHDRASTYGHLMANLGFSLSGSVLQTRQEVYVDGQGGQLRFILNGEEAYDVANRTIGDQDVLLIDFSNDGIDELHRRYAAIPRGAAEANELQDPAACAGDGERESFFQQVKDAFTL